MSKNKIKKYTRDSLFIELKEFCNFAKTHDYIEVTEGKNTEGFDVLIDASCEKKYFNLTYGEGEALKVLIKELG